MCGIVGFIAGSHEFLAREAGAAWDNWSAKSSKREELLKNLLTVSALRGIDSTGIAQILPKHDEITVAKLPVNSLQFIKSVDFADNINCINYSSVGYIGHTRYSTVGGVSLRTAHPFDMQTVVGVHNGTLTTWKYLWDKAASDSEALYHALDQTNDYISTLEDISGAYALVWYDKLEKKYFFTRNCERPLVYVKHPLGIVFASELEMIKFSLARVLGDGFEAFAKECEVKEFDVNTLYELDPDTLEFKTTEYTKKTNVVPYVSKHAGSGYYQTKAEKESPVKTGFEIELYPVGYKEYPNSDTGMGTLWGYFMVNSKMYFWNSYAVAHVKKVFEDYLAWETNGYPEMVGAISHISLVENEPNAVSMECPLFKIKVHPEMTDDLKFISHSIKPTSIRVSHVLESANA